MFVLSICSILYAFRKRTLFFFFFNLNFHWFAIFRHNYLCVFALFVEIWLRVTEKPGWLRDRQNKFWNVRVLHGQVITYILAQYKIQQCFLSRHTWIKAGVTCQYSCVCCRVCNLWEVSKGDVAHRATGATVWIIHMHLGMRYVRVPCSHKWPDWG